MKFIICKVANKRDGKNYRLFNEVTVGIYWPHDQIQRGLPDAIARAAELNDHHWLNKS